MSDNRSEDQILADMEREFDEAVRPPGAGWAPRTIDLSGVMSEVRARRLEQELRRVLDAQATDAPDVVLPKPRVQAPSRVIREPRLDDGDGGDFPPIDPGPGYGGRPGRGGSGAEMPRWLAVLMVWLAVGAAYVIDDATQRSDDLPMMVLVLVGGTAVALFGGRRR